MFHRSLSAGQDEVTKIHILLFSQEWKTLFLLTRVVYHILPNLLDKFSPIFGIFDRFVKLS